VIEKPFQADVLKETIKKALEQKRAQRKNK
jgi:hypothetical protein